MPKHDGMTLASEIFKLFETRNVPNLDGKTALVTALVITMVDDGVSKAQTIRSVSEMWDVLEPFIKSNGRVRH